MNARGTSVVRRCVLGLVVGGSLAGSYALGTRVGLDAGPRHTIGAMPEVAPGSFPAQVPSVEPANSEDAASAFDLGPVLAMGDRFAREDALDRYVRTLDTDGLRSLKATLEVQRPCPELHGAFRLLFEQWGRLDPRGGLEACASNDRYRKFLNTQAVMRGWTEVDAAGAFAALPALRSEALDRFGPVKLGLEAAMVEQERYAELAEMIRQEQELFRSVQGSTWDSLPRAWAEADFGAAHTWASSLSDPSSRDSMLCKVIGFLGETDPVEAMRLAESADARTGHPSAETEVLRTWARSDPSAAQAWLQAHGSSQGATSYAFAFAAGAGARAPAAVEPLIPLLAEDEDGIDTLVWRIGTENPPLMADWLVRFDLKVDERTRRQLFARWIATDLPGAREFILHDPRMRDELRAEMKRLLPSPP